jgi:uridylate kinase
VERDMKIVVSIGGSVLIENADPDRVDAFASVLNEIAPHNSIFVVVGGGETARKYISIGRALGANEAICDRIGIDVTRLNAYLLILALKGAAYPEVVRTYQDALVAEGEEIVVMGGVSPGYTTDAVSAILAEYVGADLLINATSVDGVYSSDPKINPESKRYEEMTAGELVEIVIRTKLDAGSTSVIDPVGAKVIERSGIKTIVLDGRVPSNILKAFRGEKIGTVIVRG